MAAIKKILIYLLPVILFLSIGIVMSFRYVFLRPVYYELEQQHLDLSAYYLARNSIDEYTTLLFIPITLLLIYSFVMAKLALRSKSSINEVE